MIRGINDNGIVVVDGFVDMHVHFREPGNPEKETIQSGTRAAKAGGYSLVCTMPNLNPAPDSLEHLKVQQELILQYAEVGVLPFATITKGRKGEEPTHYESLADKVAGFSDDGNGVQDDKVMMRCMKGIAKVGGLLAAHCELLNDPHTGAPAHDIRQREALEVERNIRLAKDTGCRLHICHVSTEDSVRLIRQGKKMGVHLTAETAPHYLVFSKEDVRDKGCFKMNPPIGTLADRNALLAAVGDGTIDVIATDHAPHTKEEKSGGFSASLNGVVGLETAFPVLYTTLVKTGVIQLERLLEMMSDAPCRILGIKKTGETQIDLNENYTIDASKFFSKGKSSPFDGMQVWGRVIYDL